MLSVKETRSPRVRPAQPQEKHFLPLAHLGPGALPAWEEAWAARESLSRSRVPSLRCLLTSRGLHSGADGGGTALRHARVSQGAELPGPESNNLPHSCDLGLEPRRVLAERPSRLAPQAALAWISPAPPHSPLGLQRPLPHCLSSGREPRGRQFFRSFCPHTLHLSEPQLVLPATFERLLKPIPAPPGEYRDVLYLPVSGGQGGRGVPGLEIEECPSVEPSPGSVGRTRRGSGREGAPFGVGGHLTQAIDWKPSKSPAGRWHEKGIALSPNRGALNLL